MENLIEEKVQDIRARLAAVDEFLKVNKRNWMTAEESARLNSPSNEELSALEVYDFKRDKPERYFAYVDKEFRFLTTWTGERLARIYYQGCETRDNFGGKRRYFRAEAINGLVYWGYHFSSSGDYARMYELKGRVVCQQNIDYINEAK